MRSWVFGCGNAFPDVQRDTVAGETAAMFATSVPLSPPRSRRVSMIFATALIVILLSQPHWRLRRCYCRGFADIGQQYTFSFQRCRSLKRKRNRPRHARASSLLEFLL